MSIELVTGHAGRNHVDSEDVGAFYAGVVGKGRYALDVGENLAVTMSDANTVRIGTGLFVMDGRYVRVKDAESVKVANGAQAAYRKDLVVCTYTRDPSNGNVEGVAVSVLQGKAAAKESDAKVPTFEEGDILNGDLKATVALAEVDLAGLTPTARLLLPNVASLKTLGESVSQTETYSSGAVHVERRGHVCVASASMFGMPAAVGSWTSGVIGTLPDGFRPASAIGGTAFVEADTNRIVPIAIEPSGSIRVLTRGVSFGKGALFSYSVAYLV